MRGPRDNRRTVCPNNSRDLVSGLMRGSVYAHPLTLLYDHDVLECVSWASNLDYHQDKDFAIRAASQGVTSIPLPRVVGIFNDHEGKRITTTKKEKAPTIEVLRRRVSSIMLGVTRLQDHNALQPHHREAAAEGLWKCAYLAAPYDFGTFRAIYDTLRDIHPSFRPQRPSFALRLLDRFGSPLATEWLLWPVRKLKLSL